MIVHYKVDLDGLPSLETLELLQGYTLLRTDRDGWIELSTDGDRQNQAYPKYFVTLSLFIFPFLW